MLLVQTWGVVGKRRRLGWGDDSLTAGVAAPDSVLSPSAGNKQVQSGPRDLEDSPSWGSKGCRRWGVQRVHLTGQGGLPPDTQNRQESVLSCCHRVR